MTLYSVCFLFQGILFIKHHLNTDYTAVGCLSHRRCDNPQVCTYLSESHMTFNKFEMLISFQSTKRTMVEIWLKFLPPTVEIQLGVVHFIATPSL